MARMSKKDRRAAGGKKKKSGLTIPAMKDVEVRKLIGKGPHAAKVIEVEPGEGDAGDYLKWTFQVTAGKYKGSNTKPYYTTLAEGKLWNLKKVLTAIGHDAAESDEDTEIQAEDFIDAECVIIVGHEEYEGRLSAAVIEFGDSDDLEEAEEEEEIEEEEEDEDEKPAKKKASKKDAKKGGKKKKDEEEEDEDEDADEEEVTEESLMEMSEEDLEDYVTESELEVDLDDYATISKKRKAVVKAAKKAKLI